jgi:DtxR family Mn-dependent transcriptional regulator
VSYRPYRGVTLTRRGEQLALSVLRRHRLWELFLVQVLGIPWSEVHEHAHRLEHATDGRLADALDSYLGHPRFDPHGAPIPAPDGTMEQEQGVPLTELEPGDAATLLRCSDESPDLLIYLGELGLVPGARVELVSRAPFGGPLTLVVDGNKQVIGPEAAGTVTFRRE